MIKKSHFLNISILICLSACASRPVKTETVTVYVPKTVQLPAEMTEPVPVPEHEIMVNSDLADYIIMLKSALSQANRKLEAIRDSQD